MNRKVVPFKLSGWKAIFAEKWGELFLAKSCDEDENEVISPFFQETNNGEIVVPFGAVLSLIRADPLHKFKLTEVKQNLYFPEIELIQPGEIKLREYQKKASIAALNTTGGIIRISPSGGKTEIGLSIAASFAKYCNVLLLVPTNIIADEWIRRGKKYHIDIHSYRESRNKFTESKGITQVGLPINVVNDYKHKNNRSFLRSVGCVIPDECQAASADTYQSALLQLPNLSRVYGLSATPLDYYGKFNSFLSLGIKDAKVYAATGPIIHETSPQEIKQYISLPVLINLNFNWHFPVHELRYNLIMRRDLVSRHRLQFISELIHSLNSINRNCIVNLPRLLAGKKILQTLDNQVKVACWFGGGTAFTKDKKLDSGKIPELVDSGKIQHLICSTVADKGANVPDLDTTILVEGRKASNAIQRVGRIIRKKPKKRAVIINLFDSESHWVFHGQAKARSRELAKYYGINPVELNSIDEVIEYLK